MDPRLKQRLIGAAVLVALAVIFLPMFLTGPVERQAMDVPIEIPPRPQMAEAPGVPEPAELRTVSQRQPTAVPVDRERPAPETVSERSAEPQRSEPQRSEPQRSEPQRSEPQRSEPQPAPRASASSRTPPQQAAPRPELGSWAVQVGSFGSRDNAMRLRDQLREAGFSAYVDTPEVSGSRFYRVRVGPVVERSDAQSLLGRLEQEQSLSGLVVAHP